MFSVALITTTVYITLQRFCCFARLSSGVNHTFRSAIKSLNRTVLRQFWKRVGPDHDCDSESDKQSIIIYHVRDGPSAVSRGCAITAVKRQLEPLYDFGKPERLMPAGLQSAPRYPTRSRPGSVLSAPAALAGGGPGPWWYERQQLGLGPA